MKPSEPVSWARVLEANRQVAATAAETEVEVRILVVDLKNVCEVVKIGSLLDRRRRTCRGRFDEWNYLTEKYEREYGRATGLSGAARL